MKRRAVLLLLALAGFGCGEPRKPAAAATKTPETTFLTAKSDHPYDGDNLLNLAFGASVVSRTGEQNLETSAIHVLDGSPLTSWVSPPGGPRQSAVFSFPATARLDEVGVLAPSKDVPSRVHFAASTDGTTWRDVTTLTCKLTPETQKAVVEPFDARYLRVEMLEDRNQYSILTSVHAGGELLGPPEVPEIDGCWRINGAPARFVRKSARVVGVIGTEPPVQIDGGSDGRVYRLMWYRGPMWGFTTITVAPDGKTLSGLKWHEEVNPVHVGDGWFGERVPCAAVRPIEDMFDHPQTAAEEVVTTLDHPVIGRYRTMTKPIALSETPGPAPTAAPVFGQHSDEILAGFGYSQDQIAALRACGAVR